MKDNQRKVQVLHKRDDDKSLAVGKTFRFLSGDRYTVQENGSVVNADPKPYRNKKERKAWLKQRRQAGSMLIHVPLWFFGLMVAAIIVLLAIDGIYRAELRNLESTVPGRCAPIAQGTITVLTNQVPEGGAR